LPRNNTRRTGSTPKEAATKAAPAPAASVLDFVTPTELVDLPSRGRFYSEDHPLHNKETVEIRYMTAKDEDILTSQTLLKKGVALERLMQNILVDKSVNPATLLSGDRNAILVGARITGYGPKYKANVGCPSCGDTAESSFDLSDLEAIETSEEEQQRLNVSMTENTTFITTLPLTGVAAEFRLLTGADERVITQNVQKKRNKNVLDGSLSTQFSRAVLALNDETDRATIQKFMLMMPARDARHLRSAFQAVTPNVDLAQDFECSACGYEQQMEVPLTADFFWPDR